MPNETLTPAEAEILLALMAEAREISNNELEELHGFTITGATRTKLNNLKLVESRKQGRQFVHELSEHGWRRCRDTLSAGRPKGARGKSAGALYAILAGLNRYLEREDLVPADIFQPTIAHDPTDPTPTPTPVVAPSTPSTTDDLEGLIRDAYKQLASRPGGWVGLAELRPLLGDASRADVDRELKRMDRLPGISVIPEENQKTLTREERDAAVKIGGKDNHLIAIEDA